MTYFTKIQLISQEGGGFADEVSFYFNRRWRRFAQIFLDKRTQRPTTNYGNRAINNVADISWFTEPK